MVFVLAVCYYYICLALYRVGDGEMKIFLLKAITIITVALVTLALICSCTSVKQIEYYSQKENYISTSGTVTHMSYNKDSTALYLEFDELSHTFDDSCFKIVGENLKIVQANGIDYKINLGDRIDFITAPRYFGDGYVMPIVAVSINGESLLDFDEGYENLIIWLSK